MRKRKFALLFNRVGCDGNCHCIFMCRIRLQGVFADSVVTKSRLNFIVFSLLSSLSISIPMSSSFSPRRFCLILFLGMV